MDSNSVFNKAKEWMEENKESTALIILSIVGIGAKFVKDIVRNANLNKAENIKRLYVYDRSLGHYWHLRRELDDDEWAYVESRRNRGDSLGKIFRDMHVLK